MVGKAQKDVANAWVAREEIRGVREIDRPDGEHSIAFDYNIGDQTFEVFVDVEEEIGFLSVYIYAPVRAPENRVDELIRLGAAPMAAESVCATSTASATRRRTSRGTCRLPVPRHNGTPRRTAVRPAR